MIVVSIEQLTSKVPSMLKSSDVITSTCLSSSTKGTLSSLTDQIVTKLVSPMANDKPSGLKATAVTSDERVKVRTFVPVLTVHSTVVSSREPETSCNLNKQQNTYVQNTFVCAHTTHVELIRNAMSLNV